MSVSKSRLGQITDGAAHVTQATLLAGERNQDSATNSYLVTHEEVNYSVVSVADNTTTVYAGPCFFYGLYVNSAIGEPLVIKDGTTAVFTVAAAALSANTYVGFGNHGIRMDTSLVIDPDDTSTELDLIVLWRPI